MTAYQHVANFLYFLMCFHCISVGSIHMTSYAPVWCPFTVEIKCSFSPCWLYDNMATLMTSVHTSYTLERKESKIYCIYPSTSQPTNGKCFISEGGEGRGESMSRCACIPYCLKLMTGCLSYS